MKLTLRRKLEITVSVAAVLVLVSLPFCLGTQSYPVAIVRGNSMYPDLQNGDLVLFKNVNQQSVPLGTIIVFVQSDTGVTALDAITKPIIIHRVVGSFIQDDGTVCYETKGDNNGANDPSSVRADHVLGTPVLIIPKVGLLILFLSSSQGLVAAVGFITIVYLTNDESKMKAEKVKEAFLRELARLVMNGELAETDFMKLEFAVKYADTATKGDLNDSFTMTILDWLQNSASEKTWKVSTQAHCPDCSSIANSFENSYGILFICPKCISQNGKGVYLTKHTKKNKKRKVLSHLM